MYISSAVKWQPPIRPQLPVDSWMAPQKDTYFFCDLHADAEAFLRSLKLSHLITRDSRINQVTLTTKGQHGQIIIGGDCFDKGPSNLDLFRLIQQLHQSGADLVLLAGNHDIRIYAGLLALDFMQDLRQAHFFVRMGRKTASLFSEIYHHYCQNETTHLSNNEILEALFPPSSWFEFFPVYAATQMDASKARKELKQIEKKQQDFLLACQELGLELCHIYLAAQKAKELFIDDAGEFAWFFKNLDLIHTAGSYCFSHAGLDDTMAQRLCQESVEEINEAFRQQMRQGRIFQLYYSELGNVFRTKYRDKDWPLTQIGSEQLKTCGIYAMVNGHRSHNNGQQLFVREGLLNFECDTQLNSNCRKKSNIQTPGEAVTIFYADGLVSALSSDFPATKQFHPRHL